MKGKPILFLAGCALFAACTAGSSITVSQKNFVERLKRSQDTVTQFKKYPVIQQRIITNMGKFVAANMNFAKWTFKVEKVSENAIELKVPAGTDTAGYNVKYVINMPVATAAVQTALEKVNEGDNILVDGKIAMLTADGKINMNDYFTTDSLHFIKIDPVKVQ